MVFESITKKGVVIYLIIYFSLNVEKICFLIDFKGMTMDNFDHGLFWKSQLCFDMQMVYESVVETIYILNAGWVFKSIWFIISKCIHCKVQKKLKICIFIIVENNFWHRRIKEILY